MTNYFGLIFIWLSLTCFTPRGGTYMKSTHYKYDVSTTCTYVWPLRILIFSETLILSYDCGWTFKLSNSKFHLYFTSLRCMWDLIGMVIALSYTSPSRNQHTHDQHTCAL